MCLVTLLNFDGGRRSGCGELLGEHPCRGIWQTVKLVHVGGKLLLCRRSGVNSAVGTYSTTLRLALIGKKSGPWGSCTDELPDAV